MLANSLTLDEEEAVQAELDQLRVVCPVYMTTKSALTSPDYQAQESIQVELPSPPTTEPVRIQEGNLFPVAAHNLSLIFL
jgi:hypothetical protein